MKKLFKYFGYATLGGLVVSSLYMVNLFIMRPYSIDHFLAKELVMDMVDSPEMMTYLGIFDNYNVILKHNQKLSVSSLEDADQDHADRIKRLKILNKYDSKNLSEIQKITKKIAIFDVENDIHEFENFRFHSHPFNQISGGHLNIVEFMTDTHPVKITEKLLTTSNELRSLMKSLQLIYFGLRNKRNKESLLRNLFLIMSFAN